ncbi:hypothetical protein Tco_1562009 [Tanacetum coccineum]
MVACCLWVAGGGPCLHSIGRAFCGAKVWGGGGAAVWWACILGNCCGWPVAVAWHPYGGSAVAWPYGVSPGLLVALLWAVSGGGSCIAMAGLEAASKQAAVGVVADFASVGASVVACRLMCMLLRAACLCFCCACCLLAVLCFFAAGGWPAGGFWPLALL